MLNFLKRNPLSILVIIVIVVGLVFWKNSGGGAANDAKSTQQETAAPIVSPSAAPSATPNPAPELVGPQPLTPEMEEFRARVLKYEGLRISAVRPENIEAMKELATPEYMASHVMPDGLPVSNIVIQVDPGTKSNFQLMSDADGVRKVLTSISFVRMRDGVPVDPAAVQWDVHASTWKLIDGVWRVVDEDPVVLK